MEVNIVRPFMVRNLQAFYKHDSPQMVPQADTTGSEHDMHVPITYVVLTHDCLSMWLVISFVLLISVYLLIWFSCSLVNFGKSNFLQFLISY